MNTDFMLTGSEWKTDSMSPFDSSKFPTVATFFGPS